MHKTSHGIDSREASKARIMHDNGDFSDKVARGSN